jgi:hypothetical protein
MPKIVRSGFLLNREPRPPRLDDSRPSFGRLTTYNQGSLYGNLEDIPHLDVINEVVSPFITHGNPLSVFQDDDCEKLDIDQPDYWINRHQGQCNINPLSEWKTSQMNINNNMSTHGTHSMLALKGSKGGIHRHHFHRSRISIMGRWDPYASLKLNDEMDQFYKKYTALHPHGENINNREFRRHLSLLQVKLRQVLSQIKIDNNEDFNFVFRDYIGHLSLLLDAVSSRGWTVAFLTPFLKYGKFQGPNTQQAFNEVCLVIRRVSHHQADDQNLSERLISIVWRILVDVMKAPSSPNSFTAFEALQSILADVPISYQVVNKIVAMRSLHDEFYDEIMIDFRCMRVCLMEHITHRIQSASTDRSADIVSLLQECYREFEISYGEESSPIVKNIIENSTVVNDADGTALYTSSCVVQPSPSVQQHFRLPLLGSHGGLHLARRFLRRNQSRVVNSRVAKRRYPRGSEIDANINSPPYQTTKTHVSTNIRNMQLSSLLLKPFEFAKLVPSVPRLAQNGSQEDKKSIKENIHKFYRAYLRGMFQLRMCNFGG